MNNNENKLLADVIDNLVDERLNKKLKNSMKQKEVIIKKVYNADNYSKRTVDVSMRETIFESVALKNIPVNIPYPISVGDEAYLYYWGDKPENGSIGGLITQKSTKGINAETLEGKYIKVLTQLEYDNIIQKDLNTIYFILE